MSGKKKRPVATSTVAQARVRLYQPTKRPRMLVGDWIETSYGRCRVKGRLGQRHADLMEAILYCAEKSRTIEDGGVELLVDPAHVRKILSDSYYSFAQIQKLKEELRSALIIIELPYFDSPIVGGLIDYIEPSPMKRLNPLTGKERNLWRVRLAKVLVQLLNNDLRLYYNPEFIAKLQHGISKAVARHILTHKNEPTDGWFTDTAIKLVDGDRGSQALRNARRRIKEDAEKLKDLGIIVDGNRIRKIPTDNTDDIYDDEDS